MTSEFEVELLRQAVKLGAVHWSRHALRRSLERSIPRQRILDAILKGEVIEVYPQDMPLQSLLLMHTDREPLHVVCAYDATNRVTNIITVYHPDLEHFEPDLKTRRRKT